MVGFRTQKELLLRNNLPSSLDISCIITLIFGLSFWRIPLNLFMKIERVEFNKYGGQEVRKNFQPLFIKMGTTASVVLVEMQILGPSCSLLKWKLWNDLPDDSFAHSALSNWWSFIPLLSKMVKPHVATDTWIPASLNWDVL